MLFKAKQVFLVIKTILTEFICTFERTAKYELTCLLKPLLFMIMSKKGMFLMRCHGISLIRE